MSGSKFNDFSAHVDGSSSAEKGSEQGLRPGMKVTLMDSNDRGVIRHVRKDCVEIELDYGFVIPVGFHDFIVNDTEEDRKLRQSVGALQPSHAANEKSVFTNKAVEIDLHIEALPGGHGVAKGQQNHFCAWCWQRHPQGCNQTGTRHSLCCLLLLEPLWRRSNGSDDKVILYH